ncbi:MAG: hypothetical protein ISS41_01525 [Candidatus Aminicenantes bacterium]|nr:hypothetical protein [Candidatus Aminicenantes bacterium]MBL7082293.1 hypothetical protein [Candidatus Aminicenantes bacterium]
MRQILRELKNHAPFTAFGAITGIVLIVVIILFNVLSQVSRVSSIIFYILHPAHVVLSAIATTAMYKLNRTDFKLLWGIIIGYTGSIVIATLSDSLIPYLGELLLNLPNKGIHIGLIEEPLIINGAAFLGILIALLVPKTKFSHSGHVLLSTWASLFHILMAIGQTVSLIIIFPIFLFLFLAVWVPCCLSDIIFPLLFVPVKETREK